MARTIALTVLSIMLVFPVAMGRLFVTANAQSLSPAAGSHERDPAGGQLFKGKMSFDEEDWKSDAAPSTCTCTCTYPARASPKTPSQRSPVERKRSPPPLPLAPYWPSPSSDTPSSKSPVSSFTSPPPAPNTPYGDVPNYEQPSPVVATSPQTFVPSPTPPPIY